MAKRFAAINVESTEESRRVFRSLLLATPGLGEFISGVILFEEMLGQKTDSAKLNGVARYSNYSAEMEKA
jgi:fructose-bisphosphate aldolase, class I